MASRGMRGLGSGGLVEVTGRRADLPTKLATIHPKWRTPWVAELAVAAVVIAVISLADVRHAIGFSSVTVLTYYAITNLSALTLEGGRAAKIVAAVGLESCSDIRASGFKKKVGESAHVNRLPLSANSAVKW